MIEAPAGLDLRVLAHRPHHLAHIAPVARLLGWGGDTSLRRASSRSIVVVASYGDLAKARRLGYQRIVLMQHGAGQSYAGDHRSARHPAYPGGDDNDDVGLFLVPNDGAAERWRERYPQACIEVVGCPKLETLPQRAGSMGVPDTATVIVPTVAVSFHWNYHGIPEMRSAFAWHSSALPELARRFTLIGHQHPKRRDLEAIYRAHGIEYVADFGEVCRRADVYVCDNSSTMFEFASTGRPVVALDAPWYRREVSHGLRFWNAPFAGVSHPAELPAVVEYALRQPELWRGASEAAADLAYTYRTGAAARAAAAIEAWAA